jgi:hypothetical protein
VTRHRRARHRREWNRDRRYVRQRYGARWDRWARGGWLDAFLAECATERAAARSRYDLYT